MKFDNKHTTDSKYGRIYLILVHVLFAVVMATVLALVFGYLVMLLWNAVIPDLTGTHTISYGQSISLLVLARILVGGFSHHGSGHGHMKHRKARRDYEEWWQEVGKNSFENFKGYKHPKE